MDKVECCYMDSKGQGCEEEAEFTVWDGKEPAYDHLTYACIKHVGHLYNHTDEMNVFYPIEWDGWFVMETQKKD